MKTNAIRAIVVGFSFLMISEGALACGESLFRVGKGVAFREYTAPLPGSILVVARTEAELAMVAHLAAAGHDIHVVSDPSEIGSELDSYQFDIVLAYYSQRDVVENQIGTSSVTYLPVAMNGTGEVAEADGSYRRSLQNDDSVLVFLRTIHRTLRDRA